MERLTWHDAIGQALLAPTYNDKYDALELIDILLDKLAAYEDTGLEPEQVAEVYRRFSEARAIAEELGQKYADRADELLLAEAEDRLLVLPCQVGDTVYRVETAPNGKKAMPAYPKYYVYAYTVRSVFGEEVGMSIFARRINQDGMPMSSYEVFRIEDFGKTVFLTREEAEAALGKERDTDAL